MTAVRTGGGIRSTVSGSDGVYSFADLPPGAWSLTVQVDGYPEASVPSLQVVSNKATRRDVVMNGPAAGICGDAIGCGTGARATPSPLSLRVRRSCPDGPDRSRRRCRRPPPAPEVDLQTPFAVGDHRLDERHLA